MENLDSPKVLCQGEWPLCLRLTMGQEALGRHLPGSPLEMHTYRKGCAVSPQLPVSQALLSSVAVSEGCGNGAERALSPSAVVMLT